MHALFVQHDGLRLNSKAKTKSAGVGLTVCADRQNPKMCLLRCRDNILFGKELFPERYQAVLKACALEADVQQMAQGDATLIGDRGVTLSGGQRARLSLARAIYQVHSLHASHRHIIFIIKLWMGQLTCLHTNIPYSL